LKAGEILLPAFLFSGIFIGYSKFANANYQEQAENSILNLYFYPQRFSEL
jgi:hypothetical protein